MRSCSEILSLAADAGRLAEARHDAVALLAALCRRRGLRFGTAESCTGGLIAATVTDVPGVSEVFAGGIVSYANEVKERCLGVPCEVLEAHGAVSAETADAMARGAVRALGCGLAVSVTGIAGPGGAGPGKPVGTVYAAVCAEGAVPTVRRFDWGERHSRETIRHATALAALDMLADAALSIPAAGGVRFGLVADPHVADRAPEMGRQYREAGPRLRAAATTLAECGAEFLVEMGDLKDRGGDAEETLRFTFQAADALGSGFPGPVFPVLGNHDVDCLTKAQFLREWDRAFSRSAEGTATAPYGAWDRGGIRFLRLDCDFFPDGRELADGDRNHRDCTVPAGQVAWLRDELASAPGPCVVFCHSPLTGDWDSVVTNGAEIRAALEAAGNVAAVFQAHTHRAAFRSIRGVLYCTVPSICHDEGPYSLATVYPDGGVEVRGFRGAPSLAW